MSPHALPVPLGDYDLGNCNFRRANGLIEKSLRQLLWIISFELERAAKAARFGSRFTACGGRLIAFGGRHHVVLAQARSHTISPLSFQYRRLRISIGWGNLESSRRRRHSHISDALP